jgi:uncharacterized protein (TIGR00725 family)
MAVLKPKISVSGSAANNCGEGAFKKAYETGFEIAKQGGVLVSGATIGIPAWATRGAKKAGGLSIGLSPASSRQEHVKKYHLPTSDMDVIIYTGSGYSGRNLQMIRACDAVIEICGRIGTLNEFTVAFEDHKPIGILLGTGGASDELPKILEVAKRGKKNIFYDTDPKRLVSRLIKEVKRREKSLASAEKVINKRTTDRNVDES